MKIAFLYPIYCYKNHNERNKRVITFKMWTKILNDLLLQLCNNIHVAERVEVSPGAIYLNLIVYYWCLGRNSSICCNNKKLQKQLIIIRMLIMIVLCNIVPAASCELPMLEFTRIKYNTVAPTTNEVMAVLNDLPVTGEEVNVQ